MRKTIKKTKAPLPDWAKTTPPPLAVSAEPDFTETPAAPSPLPWRRQLAGWPEAWREAWGVRANALEDQGRSWRDAEQQAFVETLKAKREEAEAKPSVELKVRKPERTLFRESA